MPIKSSQSKSLKLKSDVLHSSILVSINSFLKSVIRLLTCGFAFHLGFFLNLIFNLDDGDFGEIQDSAAFFQVPAYAFSES